MNALAMKKIDLTAKEAAKLIRTELKKAFPGVKFSVTKSGCESVYVSYTADLDRVEVRDIASKFGSARGTDEFDNVQYCESDMFMTADGPVVYNFRGYVIAQKIDW